MDVNFPRTRPGRSPSAAADIPRNVLSATDPTRRVDFKRMTVHPAGVDDRLLQGTLRRIAKVGAACGSRFVFCRTNGAIFRMLPVAIEDFSGFPELADQVEVPKSFS